MSGRPVCTDKTARRTQPEVADLQSMFSPASAGPPMLPEDRKANANNIRVRQNAFRKQQQQNKDRRYKKEQFEIEQVIRRKNNEALRALGDSRPSIDKKPHKKILQITTQ